MSLLEQHKDQLSSQYLVFLEKFPEGKSVGEYVYFYGKQSLDERNETYEVQTYLPGAITVGDDGGGQAILLLLDGSNQVLMCGHGALGSCEPQKIADDFDQWLQDDCPLPEEGEEDFPLTGDLWLLVAPNGGLKDLLRLKNLLGLSLNLGELKALMNETPCILARRIPPIAYRKRLEQDLSLAACVGFSDCDSEMIRYRIVSRS